jgi:hypothetical protein
MPQFPTFMTAVIWGDDKLRSREKLIAGGKKRREPMQSRSAWVLIQITQLTTSDPGRVRPWLAHRPLRDRCLSRSFRRRRHGVPGSFHRVEYRPRIRCVHSPSLFRFKRPYIHQLHGESFLAPQAELRSSSRFQSRASGCRECDHHFCRCLARRPPPW